MTIEGMPVSVMRHHKVNVGVGPGRRAAQTFSFTLAEHERVRVEVTGPRYMGRRWVSRAECDAEPELSLSVQPLPAELTVTCPPKGTTMVCQDCPAPIGGKVYFPDQFPAIDVEDFETKFWVLFRAPGYQRKLEQITVHPGPNARRLVMEAL